MSHPSSRFIFATACLLTFASAACAKQPADRGRQTSPVTLGELQQRLITYAGSLRQRSDASEQRFATMLGVTLVPLEPGAKGGRATQQYLADGYRFHASFSAFEGPTWPPLHEVLFYRDNTKAVTEDTAAACLWTADEAGKALEAVGYLLNGERAFQRGRMQGYWRPVGDGSEIFTVSLLTYVAKATTAPETCVYGVRYWGGKA